MQDLRYKAHSRAVALWIENTLPPDDKISPVLLIDEFEKILALLLNRIRLSVGESTLAAVADRVLYNSSGHYPLLMKIQLDPLGFDFGKMRDDPLLQNVKEIKEAFHYFITELLFVIGKLSGGSLTPRLHGILASRATKGVVSVGGKKKDEK